MPIALPPLIDARLPGDRCLGCGCEAIGWARIARAPPPAVWFAATLALPLLLAVAIRLAWAGRDLFEVMAGGAGAVERALLRALPVAVPALWAPLVVVAVELWSLRRGADGRLCPPCVRRERRRRVVRAGAVALAMPALAAWLYLTAAEDWALDELKWGLLFLPWAALALLLPRRRGLGNLAIGRGAGGCGVLLGPAAPGAVAGWPRPDPPERAWLDRPAPADLVAWLLTLAIAALLYFTPRLAYPLACPYGTYALAFLSGEARVIGCRAPDGSAHGPNTGAAGAWNSAPDAPGYRGRWWFGQPSGGFELTGRGGELRARGEFDGGRAVGVWRLWAHGQLVEELEVDGRTLAVRVRRPHPHLGCAPEAIESAGSPAWGERACPRGPRQSPYIRVQNARVVERGSRPPLEPE